MFDLQLDSLQVKLHCKLSYNAFPIALQLANLVIFYKQSLLSGALFCNCQSTFKSPCGFALQLASGLAGYCALLPQLFCIDSQCRYCII